MTKYEGSWKSLCSHPVPEWFRDEKFGIYTHWGPYTVPAYGGSSDALSGVRGVCNSAWYPRRLYQTGQACAIHHQKTYGNPAEFGYKDLIPLFAAEKIDPEEWVEIFQDAGARFVGLTAQLHDGFALWDSKVNRWNCKAIYRTRPWCVAGEGPTKHAVAKSGHFNETGEARFCAHDIRFTAGKDAIYATCLGIPGDQVSVNTFKERLHVEEVAEVTMLGVQGPLKWRYDWDEGLTINVPEKVPSDYANTFKIKMQ